MGNYSYFLYASSNASSYKIDWSRVGKTAKNYFKGHYGFDLETITNLEEFCKAFHDLKFIGYMDNELIFSLIDLNEHGLTRNKEDTESIRIYYDYEGFDQVHCLEFYPGTRKILHGIYKFNDSSFEYKKNEDDDSDEEDDKYSDMRKEYMMKCCTNSKCAFDFKTLLEVMEHNGVMNWLSKQPDSSPLKSLYYKTLLASIGM